MNELNNRNSDLIALEINSIKEQTQKIFLLSSIEIGKRLVEVKKMLPRGEWGNWLKKSVDYSQRTANNLMKIYDEYGDQLSLSGEIDSSQAIAKLNYTQAVALLSIPAEERENFIDENALENMSTRELQEAIKEKKKLEEQLKLSDEKADKEKEAKEKLKNNVETLKEQAEQDKHKIENLEEQLQSAVNSGNDAEINQLSSSLKSKEKSLERSNDRIKELEKQLKEQPIEVPAVIEKIPKEVKEELEMLRKQISSKSHDTTIMKFKYSFDSLVKGFEEILDTLDDIEDSEASEKLRGAVRGLINKMQDEL
ncbi:DUF3102 domain-containing protein [Bacillus massiliglaciei]|uniref:DUF3102 domain-containing protein n=1 Tax=Bacillus massiliglaciei TaxID=1816693 RepID=UPI000AB6FC91|nr:DUF3102 domain-containing protein [Bacillus massiliglaciei]